MNDDCKNINPLKRSGVNQQQRVLAALLPGFAKVDEREFPDLILFAKEYASYLNYFNKNNLKDGHWEPLMAMDVSVTLSSLIRLDIQEYFTYVNDIYDKIRQTDLSQEADLKNYFKTLFDLCFSIIWQIDRHYNALPDDFEFKELVKNTLKSALLPDYYDRLLKYYDEAVGQTIIDPAGTFTFNDKPEGLILSQNFQKNLLCDIWPDSPVTVFNPAFNGATTALKIRNTASHNLFTGMVDEYLKVLSQLVAAASGYLDKTLSSFPTHSPPYALYLTFIKLFRYSQNHLNGFTARHLDLYYKDILRLNKKLPEPDHAHLTFELAKTAPETYLLPKNTLFKAAKDIDGLDIFYSLKSDVVLSKAGVASLKNIFVDKNNSSLTRRVLAGSVANSQDGLGAKLLSPDKSWLPFGDAQRTEGQIGFGIATPYLYLQEGVREITFKFYAPENETIAFNVALLKNRFTLQLSAEKGWLDVPLINDNISIDATKQFFSIKINLDGGEPPIVPYSSEIHGYNFEHTLPMALFTLKSSIAWEQLWDFELFKVGIDLNIKGIKSLAVENDEGVLNPTKPFDLFGSTPHVGSAFVVGCKELFMKAGRSIGDITANLSLNWDNFDELKASWNNNNDNYYQKVTLQLMEADNKLKKFKLKDEAVDASDNKIAVNQVVADSFKDYDYRELKDLEGFKIDVLYLEDAVWKDKDAPITDTLFEKSGNNPVENSVINCVFSGQLDTIPDYTANENLSTKSKWGFLKLVLKDDFGHSTYARDLADAAKAATITTTGSSENSNTTINIADVPEPYTPKIKAISLNYKVATELGFSAESDDKIIRIGPFGHKDISFANFPQNLLPQFTNEGELFIGFEGLQSGQTLSVLFQLAEGTANPLMDKQALQWHYLKKGNLWEAFKKDEISDATNGLIKSGIITFSITDEATDQNTLMGEQLHWFKVTVPENTGAICKIIDIVAQAAVVQFDDYKNTGNYFKNTLPANTISKLVIADAAIKKIAQPYASIGGRAPEKNAAYYQRVSERLRHKQRAISMWDYERLVLEEFPDIFKVKCINHAQIIEKNTGSGTIYIDNELKPGQVLLVSVPNLHNKNAFDPLRPYTSLGRLQDIKKYLADKVSPHLNLDVRNPRFEEIQLEFKIQYRTDDFALYTKQLKIELEQFMAPWAFDAASDIEFGSKISKSVLINFIEERPYVDTVSCVKMYRIFEGLRSNDMDEAIASSARSVFVSVKSGDPNYAHIINESVSVC